MTNNCIFEVVCMNWMNRSFFGVYIKGLQRTGWPDISSSLGSPGFGWPVDKPPLANVPDFIVLWMSKKMLRVDCYYGSCVESAIEQVNNRSYGSWSSGW